MHFVGGGIQRPQSQVTHSAVTVPAGASIIQPGALASLGGCPLVDLILSELIQPDKGLQQFIFWIPKTR